MSVKITSAREQVDRDNIVWQARAYLGEYGFVGVSTGLITHDFPNWQQILQGEVAYLKSQPLAGFA